MTDYSALPDTMMPQLQQQILQRISALETALEAQQKVFDESIKTIKDRITEARQELTQVNARLK